MRVRAAISPHGGDGKSRTAPHFLNCSERAQTFFFRSCTPLACMFAASRLCTRVQDLLSPRTSSAPHEEYQMAHVHHGTEQR